MVKLVQFTCYMSNYSKAVFISAIEKSLLSLYVCNTDGFKGGSVCSSNRVRPGHSGKIFSVATGSLNIFLRDP